MSPDDPPLPANVRLACEARISGPNAFKRFVSRREIAIDDAHRWGIVHKVAPAAATEEAALAMAEGVAALDPEGVARLKSMLHEHDGVVERSAAEGRGQVEWQRSGRGLPYMT